MDRNVRTEDSETQSLRSQGQHRILLWVKGQSIARSVQTDLGGSPGIELASKSFCLTGAVSTRKPDGPLDSEMATEGAG